MSRPAFSANFVSGGSTCRTSLLLMLNGTSSKEIDPLNLFYVMVLPKMFDRVVHGELSDKIMFYTLSSTPPIF